MVVKKNVKKGKQQIKKKAPVKKKQIVVESKKQETKKPVATKKSTNVSTIGIVALILLIAILMVATVSSTMTPITNNSPDDKKTALVAALKANTDPILEGYVDYMTGMPNISYVSTENIDQLKQQYPFVFNESISEQFGYSVAKNGDYILEFPSVVVVYNYPQNKVKSLFYIQTV
ncbi:MAG TPA: hypothetical protein P5513_08585 [Candidatus Diapherotrites archaeon]|nr:hypothetical protein [Candidatus Diapherotrites archaeon]